MPHGEGFQVPASLEAPPFPLGLSRGRLSLLGLTWPPGLSSACSGPRFRASPPWTPCAQRWAYHTADCSGTRARFPAWPRAFPPHPRGPLADRLGEGGGGGGLGPPASPAEETLQTLRDLHLRRPRLFCPLSTTGSAQGLLSRISEKKKNAARSGWSCIHFLIEISQAPKYCFYRSVEVKYSYHSHFQKYFRPEEQRGPLPVRSHFWPRGEEPATRKE